MSSDRSDRQNKPGRPPLPPDRRCDARVNVLLPNHIYDALYQRANRDCHSIPTVVRQAIAYYLGADKSHR